VGIQRFPNLLRWTVLACCLPYPGIPKSASDCCFLFGFSLHLPVTGSAITLRVSRLQSSFRAYFALVLRPASWLALLSRTFTFELALAGSPRTNVEYDYVGKQSIPTTGLSPASPTALWAAEQELRRLDIRSMFPLKSPFRALFGAFYPHPAHQSALRAEGLLTSWHRSTWVLHRPSGHCSTTSRPTPPSVGTSGVRP
jgi:hypothetical protein